MVITGSNDHSIVLNNFEEFTDRCISGVLSESNPGVRKLGVLLFLLFLPTGDGASTLGGLFSFLSPMNGVLTREFLHCFIWWSPEDSCCELGSSVWTMAAAFQMGLSGILKSNCISGRMSGARLSFFFCACLWLSLKEWLAIERCQILLLRESFWAFNLVLEAFRFLSPQPCQVAVKRKWDRGKDD